MTLNLKDLHWRLIIGLGALALIRPLVSTVETQMGIEDPPAVPILLTIGISIVWIAVVGLGRVARPVLTLVMVGLTYAVLSSLMAAILSPLLTGELQGPLTNPFGLVAVIVTNVIWGLICGALALLVQRLRRGSSVESRHRD